MMPTGRPTGAALLLVGLLAGGCGTPRPVVVPTQESPQTLRATQPQFIAQLQRDVDALLAAPTLQQATWGVLVKSLERDDTIYSLNPGKLLLPSSTMKVLTLAAAAERLGWDYTYETRLVAGGELEGGVLDGPLVVVGGGDPTIDNWDGAASRLFQDWAEQLKAAGVRTVTGNLIGDDNSFDDEPLGAGWMWDDLDRSFATGVGALQFNENTAQLTLAPGSSVGDRAVVTAAPPGAELVVRSQVTTGAGDSPAALTTERLPGTATLEVRGSIPLGGRPIVRNMAALNPTLYFVNELRSALIANGVEIRGAAVDIDDVSDDRDKPSWVAGRTLVEHRSPPLSEMAATMMKLSQNLYAETLLRALGLADETPTAVGGIAAVQSVLGGWGLAGFNQADGSGLSRYNVVTSETLVAVLTHVDRDARLREPFRAVLPIAGRDGTLEERMKGTPAEGNVRAKTGSMTGARAVAGFATTADGEPIVFSILVNNFPADAASSVDAAIDAIVVRLAGLSRK